MEGEDRWREGQIGRGKGRQMEEKTDGRGDKQMRGQTGGGEGRQVEGRADKNSLGIICQSL